MASSRRSLIRKIPPNRERCFRSVRKDRPHGSGKAFGPSFRACSLGNEILSHFEEHGVEPPLLPVHGHSVVGEIADLVGLVRCDGAPETRQRLDEANSELSGMAEQ